MPWQYKMFLLPMKEPDASDTLTIIGADNWEFCWYGETTGRILFKRPDDTPSTPTMIGEWSFIAAIVPPPSSGQVRFNSSTQNLASFVYICVKSATSNDMTTQLQALLKNGKSLRIEDKDVPTRYKNFTLNADATLVTATQNYFNCPVSFTDGGNDLAAQRVNISVGAVMGYVGDDKV